MSIASRWKGKGRAEGLGARDTGPGGTEGNVLSLDLVGSGVYDVAYTLPMKFGANGQQFSLQVDTGSSDLWIASTSCSTSSCSQTNGHLYNPSGATQTGFNFSISYLEGMAAGPIVWDQVSVGGYTIENQALAAANNVQNEPLEPDFSGILGLALPLNSIIAATIPPVTNNDPDGAAWASNLFSITPTSQAPASPFLSLAFARPGSDRVPSILGIGQHPATLVPDPSLVEYGPLVSESTGTLFWKVSVRAITVYVNGVAKPVTVGRSNTGAVFPSAVIDSGVPLILTTSTIADAIYGAIGVSPANDGNYYVPCTTPLNMTFTIDNRPEIPLHPLDLTTEPPQENNAQFCIGLIQTADAELTQDNSIGDMILGVPFMRNVYTVMTYKEPAENGTFTPLNSANQTASGSSTIMPWLGLLPLTNSTWALQEFNTVRVLNQPIPPTNGTGTAHTSNGNSSTINVGGRKMSVGIVVLIGLLSFFAFCCALFAIRWFLVRRRFQKGAGEGEFGIDRKAAYTLARRGSGQLDVDPTEDELRERRYQAYIRKERILSGSTVDSDRTQVEGSPEKLENVEEFGLRKKRSRVIDEEDEVWDPKTALGWNDETFVAANHTKGAEPGPEVPLVSDHSPPLSPERAYFSHNRQESDPAPAPHRHVASVDMPLLGIPPTMGENDKGYDTSNIHQSEPSQDDLVEFGFMAGETMAGIGTASRTSKIGFDQTFRDSMFNRDSLISMSSGGTAVNVGAGQGVDSGNSNFGSTTIRNAKSPLGFDVDTIFESPPLPPPTDSS